MDFTFNFVMLLARGLLDVGPVLILLLLMIVGLAILIGRREGWKLSDSIYFGFVTATTVGFGDFRPARRAGKTMAIVVAYLGLIQIGIIVALGVKAVTDAYELRIGLVPSTLSAPPEPGAAGRAAGAAAPPDARRGAPPATR